MNSYLMLIVLIILLVLVISNLYLNPLSKTSWSEPLFVQRSIGVGITINLKNRLGWWIYMIVSVALVILLAMVLLDKS